eukprot:TRINITY_DN868_c0_g1_i1.p3 TRINITY_DN868_c0_g1~~TRINITY_DN868_c0_g1_i1.p3  ORF type:complete len:130 (+),score=33.10 TRINITY_DN868_c0_g1_i1:66-455(+)
MCIRDRYMGFILDLISYRSNVPTKLWTPGNKMNNKKLKTQIYIFLVLCSPVVYFYYRNNLYDIHQKKILSGDLKMKALELQRKQGEGEERASSINSEKSQFKEQFCIWDDENCCENDGYETNDDVMRFI